VRAIDEQRGVAGSLSLFAVAVAVLHHVGAVPVGWLGTVGPTRWTDWLDLCTPYVVLGAAAAVLLAAGATRRCWLAGGVAGVLYTQGHGVHLAANSVNNRLDDSAVHLWDEVVGHLLWYAGLALLVVVLGHALAGSPLVVRWWGWVLAAAFGLTHATNALEGGTAVPSLLVAVGLCLWSRRLPDPLGRLVLLVYGLASLVLLGYGLRYGGWPQPGAL
jgi:hypothetical protein